MATDTSLASGLLPILETAGVVAEGLRTRISDGARAAQAWLVEVTRAADLAAPPIRDPETTLDARAEAARFDLGPVPATRVDVAPAPATEPLDRFFAIPCNPWCIFVCLAVSTATRERLATDLPDGGHDASWVVRVNLAGTPSLEVTVPGTAWRGYLRLPVPGAVVRVVAGVRVPGAEVVSIFESRPLALPPAHASDDRSTRWVTLRRDRVAWGPTRGSGGSAPGAA